MRGQIINRGDGSWLLRVPLGRGADGKRRTYNETFHGNKKDAEKRLTALLNKKDKGTFVEASKLTLNQHLDRWLEVTVRTRVRPRTAASYTDYLARYVRPTLGPTLLQRLTPFHIQGLYSHLERDRCLSPRTIRYVHSILRSALSQAKAWKLLAHNPATTEDKVVTLPQKVKREMHALSPEQAVAFLQTAKSDRLYALFAVALSTGMRPGEYLGLKWPDLALDDPEKATVTIQRTLVPRIERQPVEGNDDGQQPQLEAPRVPVWWEFGKPKTTKSSRTIPLPPSVTRALIAHRRAQAEERLAAGSKYTNHDMVFATPTGEPLTLRNLVNRHFKPILKAAGLPLFLRLYDLRHSCATLMLAQGENPKVVSERLGHKDITLTLDTYTHVLPTMQEAATQRLENTLFGTDRKKQPRGTAPRNSGRAARESASRPATVRTAFSKPGD